MQWICNMLPDVSCKGRIYKKNWHIVNPQFKLPTLLKYRHPSYPPKKFKISVPLPSTYWDKYWVLGQDTGFIVLVVLNDKQVITVSFKHCTDGSEDLLIHSLTEVQATLCSRSRPAKGVILLSFSRETGSFVFTVAMRNKARQKIRRFRILITPFQRKSHSWITPFQLGEKLIP